MTAIAERRNLKQLRREHEANRLEMEVIQQREALLAYKAARVSDVMEGYYDYSNYVDLREYLGHAYKAAPGVVPSSRNDREDGRNYPVFQTEQELSVYRGLARVMCTYHETAIGVVETLTDYGIRNGFHYEAIEREPGAGDLVRTSQRIIDLFLDENDYCGDLDRELFQRDIVDGEDFLGLWHLGGPHIAARVIEPDQVTEPTEKRDIEEWAGIDIPSSWSFGIHTDADDVVSVHGVWVKWTNRGEDWDYLPAGREPHLGRNSNVWVDHSKSNVVRNVKRGLSDFFSTRETLERARKVLKNVGEGAAIQAAIAFFRQHETQTTGAKALTFISNQANRSYSQQAETGSKTRYVQQFDSGTIVDHGKNISYLYGPMGQNNAPVYLEVYAAALRAVGVRFRLSEHMITGDASNNTYNSALVAESPTVRAMESRQTKRVRADRRMLWKVLWFAWRAGEFGDVAWEVIRRYVEIQIKPPTVAVRDENLVTNRHKIMHDSKVLSKRSWAARENLNYEQELKNMETEPAVAAVDPNGGQPAVDAGDPAQAAVGAADQNIQVAEDLVLNGAQIAAATQIVTSVATGVIPRDTGLGQLRILFNLTDQQAQAIMGSAGTPSPTTPNPKPAGAGEVPAVESEVEREGWLAWARALAFWKGTDAGSPEPK